MGVRILEGYEAGDHEEIELICALYCSTTGWTLGPTFRSTEYAEEFLTWMEHHWGVPEIRDVSPGYLRDKWDEWVTLNAHRFEG